MKRCVTTTHLDVFENSQGVLGKHTLFKSVERDLEKNDPMHLPGGATPANFWIGVCREGF